MALQISLMVVGPVQTNCFILMDAELGKCIFVDPGDNAKELLQHIREQNLTPEMILLTHGHFDHISGVKGIQEAYPGIPVYAFEDEKEIMESAEKNASTSMGFGNRVELDGVTYLQDHAKIDGLGLSIELIHTPGHTKGSCCYYVESEKILFAGDTLFRFSYGRTDLYSGSQSAIEHSIRDILMLLPDDVNVLPGHSELTSIGRERKFNPAL